MATEYKKPLPRPAQPEFTAPFWEAAKRHELVIQHCSQHDGFFFYPRERCPVCLSDRLEWAKVSGSGHVYAFTIPYQAAHPAFTEDAPYVYAAIQLDEGARIIGNVVGIEPTDVKVNMPVVAEFDDVTPEWTLVKWRPA
jgi:hypothetical protein